ncbi:MAG: ComEC/Rec2 family competence protein [Caulobacteraceae bacterium]
MLAWARASVAAQEGRGFLWSPVAFGVGAAIYLTARAEPPLWLAAGIAVLAVTGAAVLGARVPRWLGVVLALAAFGATGFAAAKARTLLVATPIVAERGVYLIEGRVIDVASPGAGGGRLLIAPFRIGDLAQSDLPRTLRITVGPDGLAGPGAAVRLRAILGPSPGPASPGAYDFARDAYFKGVGGVGYALDDPEFTTAPPTSLPREALMRLNAWRWTLARRLVEDIDGRAGGLAAAMVTGHESWITKADQEAMRSAGIAHITSISGAHMAVVGGFVFLLLRTLIAAWPWLALRAPGKKIAAVGGLLAVWTYLAVSGAPPPAVRAAVTLSVAFLAILADRQPISLRALAVAALIVLAWEPEAVAQPGFQMSFSATAALIALAEVWKPPLRELNTPFAIRAVQTAGTWVAVSIGASIVAGAATGPFAIQHFNRVAIYGLPANLLLSPLSAFWIMPSLALAAVGEAFGVGGPFAWLAGQGLRTMLALADEVSRLPHAVLTVPSAPDVALTVSFLGLLWMCLWKGRGRWLGIPFALAVSLWPRPEKPAIWIADEGGAAAVSEAGKAVLLRPDAKQFAAEIWARRRGLALPEDAVADLARHFDCNRQRCFALSGERLAVSAWWTKRAPKAGDLARLCAADVVILKADLEQRPCAGKLLLTRADFVRGGAAEIYGGPGRWRIVWANEGRTGRPWAPPPPLTPAKAGAQANRQSGSRPSPG